LSTSQLAAFKSAKENTIKKHLRWKPQFWGFGRSVSIVTDRDTGQARGFGFVEMANDGEGDKAIAAVKGMNLDGRALNVNEARPKADRSSRGGAGFGRKRW